MAANDPTAVSGHWARLEERGAYLGLRIMFLVYRLCGRIGFFVLLGPVMMYFFLFNRTARRASLDFLERVHRDPRGQRRLKERPGWPQSFRHFLSFGEAILDKIAAWVGDISARDVVYENVGIFTELRRPQRGALLIGSHLGNIEVSRALGTLYDDVKINVLLHTAHAANFNRLLTEANPRSRISLIQTADIGPDTAILLQEKIAVGEIVVIVGDRTPAGPSPRVSWVPFIGARAPFPQGPIILAALLKCPVQLIFCIKMGGRHHIIFEHFAERIELPRNRRQQTIEAWLARYAERLENYCMQHPYQWFNFFDFWKQAGALRDPTLTDPTSADPTSADPTLGNPPSRAAP